MRPYPPTWIPPLTKFDYFIFIILLIIMLVYNLTSCTTTRQDHTERWDYDSSCPYTFHHNWVDVPAFYPAQQPIDLSNDTIPKQ